MSQVVFRNLAVGYGGHPVLEDVNLELMQGRFTCILGPNGSGKTTLLKTLAHLLPALGGVVEIGGRELSGFKPLELAREMSVVLTDRVQLESATCFEVAAMGRSPHTGFFGVLTQGDRDFVMDCLEKCSAGYLADKPFQQTSEGEKQKVLIARGLAQNPNVFILDEPTSHLDIKYKLEVLSTLKKLCAGEGKTVVCTLHEPELAVKCSDYLVLVRDGEIPQWGPTRQMVESGTLSSLYGLGPHQLDMLVGTAEFQGPDQKDFFLIGSDAGSVPLLRSLVSAGKGIGAGVLHENDFCCRLARSMKGQVVSAPPYTPIGPEKQQEAFDLAMGYSHILLAQFPDCDITRGNRELVRRLQEAGREILPAQSFSLSEIL